MPRQLRPLQRTRPLGTSRPCRRNRPCGRSPVNGSLTSRRTLSLSGLRPSKPVIARIYGVGIPSILLQTVSSLLIFGLNQILVTFSETATAVYGVYFKLQGFAFLPIIGMNNGMVPIIAYNYGARKPARIMQTIKLAIAYAVGIMVVAVVV
ncbi:MAG: hypothetical protein EGQ09_04730, partial [Clostridiales bacterium]|nr:hypothetical protein [Clostridiales bacterium]